MQNGDAEEDTKLAVRLVVDGLLEEGLARAVLTKVRELAERGRPLSVAQICVRKGWISKSEARWLKDVDHPPPDLLPGLRFKELVGQGGMSRVYSAFDMERGEAVAVKILLPLLRRQEKPLREFLQEGRMLKSLQHENIVRGWKLLEHDGLVHLVMELVKGKTVQEVLDRHGVFKEEPALYIILQAARALAYLNSQGLVHRDIKPGNILIDKENRVKLCDLGLAVAQGGGLDDGTTAGTAQYIAPEQALGQADLDVRSDIYALGVTLYQLTVGKLPFEGGSDREAMARRLMEELRSPELQGIRISPHLAYFIRKMMARDREVRYQSPRELIKDIEEQIGGARSLAAQPGKVRGRKMELGKPFQSQRIVRHRNGGRRR